MNFRFHCTLCIPPNEWKHIMLLHVCDSKKSIRQPYATEFFNKIIQSNGLTCNLKSYQNWFRLSDKTWRGNFKCYRCSIHFKMISEKIEDGEIVKIHMYSSGNPCHVRAATRNSVIKTIKTEHTEDDLESRNRINGDKRLDIQKETQSNDCSLVSDGDDAANPSTGFEFDRILDVFNQGRKRAQTNKKSTKIAVVANKKGSRAITSSMSIVGYPKPKSMPHSSLPLTHTTQTTMSSNPLNWRRKDVYKFVSRLVGNEIGIKFAEHHIDGKALDYLNVENLVRVLGIKLGFAAKIKYEFDRVNNFF